MNDIPEDSDLTDLIAELRVLLQGALLLTAFLMTLPFSSGFTKISEFEKFIYITLFVCSLASVILFSAPAAQHRIERPLRDPIAFKHRATRLVIAGLVPLSAALVLASYLVSAQVMGTAAGLVLAILTALAIGFYWWTWPLSHRSK